jgi:YVTN family beta-propeller protein
MSLLLSNAIASAMAEFHGVSGWAMMKDRNGSITSYLAKHRTMKSGLVVAVLATLVIASLGSGYLLWGNRGIATSSSTSVSTTASLSSSTETSSTSSVTSTATSTSSSAVTTFQIMRTDLASRPPIGVFDAANGDIYHVNDFNNTVSVISSSTSKVVANVRVGGGPLTAVFDPQNGDIYVPNYLSDFVSVISGATNTVIANVTVVIGVEGGVFDPINGNLYWTSNTMGLVLIVAGQTNAMVGNITLEFGPQTCPVYASAEYPPNIPCAQALDGPLDPVFGPASGDIYVANSGGNTLSVISGATNSLVTNIILSSLPEDPANRSSAPGQPAFDPANGNIYVPVGGNVSVISSATNTIVATVTVGARPDQPVFNPINGDVYVPTSPIVVSMPSNSTLFIISGATNKVVATLQVCEDTAEGPVVSSNGDVYVSCGIDGPIWVIYSTAP